LIACLNSCHQGPYILANQSGRGTNRDIWQSQMQPHTQTLTLTQNVTLTQNLTLTQIDFADKGFIIKTFYGLFLLVIYIEISKHFITLFFYFPVCRTRAFCDKKSPEQD